MSFEHIILVFILVRLLAMLAAYVTVRVALTVNMPVLIENYPHGFVVVGLRASWFQGVQSLRTFG